MALGRMTSRGIGAISLGMGLWSGCHHEPVQPTAPTPMPVGPAAPTVSMAGRVVDRISGQPIQGVRMSVLPRAASSEPSWFWILYYAPQLSDADGRYTVSGIPANFEFFWAVAWNTGSRAQQCATLVAPDDTGSISDVALTSRETLAASNSRFPPNVLGTRTISGEVFQVLGTGRQPLEGAWIGWDTGQRVDDQAVFAAFTFTDESGHYLVCGLPQTQLSLAVHDRNLRRDLRKDVGAGVDTVIDIELK
jgi:hypothetical protein